MDKKLNLAEEFLLLALHEEKGTVVFAAAMALPYGLAGALLVELAQAGLVRVEGKKLVAVPRGSARDELLDGVLATVRASAKARSIEQWVGKFGRSGGKIKKELLARLVEKRILIKEERRFLWFFPGARYPQSDPRPEFLIRERVRSGIRGSTLPPERTAALIGLLHACDLVGMLFEKGERREARRRAKEISLTQPIGSAVARAVAAIRTAVIAAGAS